MQQWATGTSWKKGQSHKISCRNAQNITCLGPCWGCGWSNSKCRPYSLLVLRTEMVSATEIGDIKHKQSNAPSVIFDAHSQPPSIATPDQASLKPDRNILLKSNLNLHSWCTIYFFALMDKAPGGEEVRRHCSPTQGQAATQGRNSCIQVQDSWLTSLISTTVPHISTFVCWQYKNVVQGKKQWLVCKRFFFFPWHFQGKGGCISTSPRAERALEHSN